MKLKPGDSKLGYLGIKTGNEKQAGMVSSKVSKLPKFTKLTLHITFVEST